jgi:hypothetical protein
MELSREHNSRTKLNPLSGFLGNHRTLKILLSYVAASACIFID